MDEKTEDDEEEVPQDVDDGGDEDNKEDGQDNEEEEEEGEEEGGKDEEAEGDSVEEAEAVQPDDDYVPEETKSNKRKKPPTPRFQKIPKKKRVKAATPVEGTPKVVNAYILFCNENRPKLSADIKPNEVLTELGRQWRALDQDGKQPYEEKSKDLKKQKAAFLLCAKMVSHTHARMYPPSIIVVHP